MKLVRATEGHGPLLQRDYWGIIRESQMSPREVLTLVDSLFWEFPPEDLALFSRSDGQSGPLQVGDELDIEIFGAGSAKVRVLHRDANTLTLGTLDLHPEAGRITFGSYRNDRGDVVFHIRSRARASSIVAHAEFLVAGDAAQTNTWTDFINRVASSAGNGVLGVIHCETNELHEDESPEEMDGPTFVATGD